MHAKYEVLPIEGSEGIEFLGEPQPRRVYRPGDVIELDDQKHAVEGLLARGQIRPLAPPAVAPVAHTKGG